MSQTPAPVYSEQPTIGAHNANLAASTIRMVEGGSWKKQDTVILIPAGKMVPMKAVLSWMNLINPPNQSVQRVCAQGLEVGDAYSESLEAILAHPQLRDHRFLLTIEHDNLPPPDGFITLLKHMEAHPEFACIGGLYWTKGPGGVPQIWGDPKDPIPNFRPQPPDPNGGLVECCGTGMGFNLWRMDMFKDRRLRRPWFRTMASSTNGVGTQDLYAWSDFRLNGYRCAVACDVLVGHLDVAGDKVW
jgi:hypothetical protein